MECLSVDKKKKTVLLHNCLFWSIASLKINALIIAMVMQFNRKPVKTRLGIVIPFLFLSQCFYSHRLIASLEIFCIMWLGLSHLEASVG